MSSTLQMATSGAMRLQAIHLFRQIMRTASTVPSHNHRLLVQHRVRASFRSSASLSSVAERKEALALGELQLDNLRQQASHMRSIMRETNTLSHNAPKPDRMYQQPAAAVAAAAASLAGGTAPARAFSTARPRMADAAVASAAPSAPVAPVAAAPASSSPSAASPVAAAGPGASVSLPNSSSAFWMGLTAEGTTIVNASHTIHVLLTNNNTILTLTTLSGDTRAWSSSGTAGFKNSKKSTYMACIACAEQLGAKARNQNITNVDLEISGFHKNKKAVIKGLIKAGLNVCEIRDTTPIPFNGCKPKKARRL